MSIVDGIILVFVLFQAWRGYKAGLIRSFVALVGWIIAFFVASHYWQWVQPLFASVSSSSVVQSVLAFLSLFVAVIITLYGIAMIVKTFVDAVALGLLDKLAGAVLGIAKALLIVLVLLSIIAPFVKNSAAVQQSQIASQLLPFAPFATQLSKQMAQTAWQYMQQNPQSSVSPQ